MSFQRQQNAIAKNCFSIRSSGQVIFPSLENMRILDVVRHAIRQFYIKNLLNLFIKLSLKISLLLFVCTPTLHAQNVATKLREYFSALRENQQFNGNVLVAENGKTIYEQSFGYSDFIDKDLNTKNT